MARVDPLWSRSKVKPLFAIQAELYLMSLAFYLYKYISRWRLLQGQRGWGSQWQWRRSTPTPTLCQGYLFVIFPTPGDQLKIRSLQLKIRNFHWNNWKFTILGCAGLPAGCVSVPPDQNNMFSPPPQPKSPLKMQILSQNAIFVTEKGNFYPNNWKFTFLPKRVATKN